MAKTRTKARKRPVTRRISTRRVGAPRRRAAVAAAGDVETLQLELVLRDVARRPLRDPETFFTFRRVSDRRQLGDQVEQSLTGAALAFDIPVATSQPLVCEIDPKRYRFTTSGVFLGTPGPPITRECQLLREPSEWRPRFTHWDDLAAAFGTLKTVLRDSPDVTVFEEPTQIIGDHLVGAAYDAMSGDKVTPAKTALLNIYFKLNRTLEPISGTASWFSFVRSIVAIGRERFLALVDPAMKQRVDFIHTHLDQFRADYEDASASLHRDNVPAAWRSRITGMRSIKSTERKGNFQLTLTTLVSPDQILLDADIDESGDLLGHIADLFKHKINGGTHPHDIHELLVLQNGDAADFDLGYQLV